MDGQGGRGRRALPLTVNADSGAIFTTTSDGHKVYLNAVIDAFADDIDYAQLVKYYGNEPETQKRYSPAVCTGAEKIIRLGDPDMKHVSTSYVERHNLSVRMTVRRFTRLTNTLQQEN